MFKLYLPLLSLLLFAGCQSQDTIVNNSAVVVMPLLETTPVNSDGDAADDPAIWVNPSDSANSRILGTDKQSGLAVYNLQGQQLQFLETGRVNNVDVRQGVTVNGQVTDIAVATNRSNKGLDIFEIDASGTVSLRLSAEIGLEKIYGMCLYHRNKQDLVAFVNSKAGWYQQWLLNPQGELKPVQEGEFLIGSKPEGCVVDDASNTLYLGEEELGIWKMAADYRLADQRMLIDETAGTNLSADVEGLAIYYGAERSILMASSQGDNSYALYDMRDDRYLGTIRIADNKAKGVDGAQETDGIAISSANFGGAFAAGILVAQDGFNELPKAKQNFKLVPWAEIQTKLLAR